MQVVERLFGNRPIEINGAQRDRSDLIRERLIGASRWAAQARAQVEAHAAHDNTVVLDGEPGTGKEFLARLIHKCSRRSEAPFVSISFDSVSDESAEAALFGSVRTLPTGTRHIHRGLIEAAEGGVIYIGNISSLSISLWAKISRLTRAGEFQRLNDGTTQRADVRILLGSTSDFGALNTPGWTLADSASRLGDRFSLPPLRDRLDDIEPLVKHFIKRACEQAGLEVREATPDIIKALGEYAWPGNVEELKTAVERMVQNSGPPRLALPLLPSGPTDAPETTLSPFPESGIDLFSEVRRHERAILCAALSHCRGVQNKAARLLKIKPTTLNMKLKSHGIDAGDFK